MRSPESRSLTVMPSARAERQHQRNLRQPVSAFPFGHGFVADAQLVRQLPLGQVLRLSALRNEVADADLVHGPPSFHHYGTPNAPAKPPTKREVEFRKIRETRRLSFHDSHVWPVKRGIVCLDSHVGMIEAKTGSLSAFFMLWFVQDEGTEAIPSRKEVEIFGMVQEKRGGNREGAGQRRRLGADRRRGRRKTGKARSQRIETGKEAHPLADVSGAVQGRDGMGASGRGADFRRAAG